jgi:phospholipase/carboxylesterase
MPVMDIVAFSSKLIETLWALEGSFRRVNSLLLAQIREELLGYEGLLRSGLEVLPVPGGASQESTMRNSLVRAADLVLEAISIFGSGEDLTQSFLNVLKAYRKLSRAQEALFDLRHDLMQVDCYFLEPALHAAAGGHDHHDQRDSSSGISHVGMENDAYSRGGYSLYVPESYDPERSWPLVVALHGGYGHGRDYLWTWLREARSRGFVLISPTSLGQTWSLSAIEIDALQLAHHVEDVCSRFTVDRSRILITGMSDGATFALCLALQERSLFTAAAPVSGVLPPMDLSHARGRRIFWVHGALDWMFPVSRAVQACRALREAGADVVLKVIRDLSHAYPREENGGILAWFDPALTIPV